MAHDPKPNGIPSPGMHSGHGHTDELALLLEHILHEGDERLALLEARVAVLEERVLEDAKKDAAHD